MSIVKYIAHILLFVQFFMLNYSNASNQLDCDQKNEFFCSKDEHCIPMSKVCNFEDDCSDGQDESSCGSCDFRFKPERCGLIFESDRIFTWMRRQSQVKEDAEMKSSRSRRVPFNYMYIDIAKNHKQYLERGHSSQNIVYRPKILFPHLKPTDNEKCSFVFDVFVTEKPAKDSSSSNAKLLWPNIKVLLIQPKDKEEDNFINGSGAKEYKTYDLKLEKTIGDGNRTIWLSKEVLINARATIWTLELVVELKIKSFLIHLSNFRFLDCQRIVKTVDEDSESDEIDLLDLNAECDKNQFKCIMSGICIDKSLLCDYGYDCGDDDTSDEEFCDNYPGRCDFEEETKCDWVSSPSYDSWIWMSALEEDQAKYADQAHLKSRPHVDHTFMSDIIGGHYMMLKTQNLSSSSMYRFTGPNVALRKGAKECSFRFWVYTPKNLDNITFESVQMIAGNKRFLSNEMFNHKSKAAINNDDAFKYRSSSQNWKRYEIEILNRDINIEGSLFAQISFGRMSGNDLKSFINNNGFIALDDFSFTPGCSLTFQGYVVDNMCGDNEFFCKISTPITNIYCIPIEYYCDFKNDCGSYKASNDHEITSDEQDCPHECLFHNKDHCGYEIIDGYDLRLTGEISEKSAINEAFSYARVYSKQDFNDGTQSSPGYMIIHAHGDKYLRRLDKKGTINLRNFRIELPTFSVSHANCLFELTYVWTPETQNIFATISIESEQFTRQSIVIKKLIPTHESMIKRQTIKLGLGHRSKPFKVVIELLYNENLAKFTNDRERERRGSFYLYEYKFIDCSFQNGLISGSESDIQFEEPADDYGYVDYPVSVPTVNAACEQGFYQCQKPLVCIEDKYVCDLKLDCQTSELDELECGQVLRYTFEECDINKLPRDWSTINSRPSIDSYNWKIGIASDLHELKPPFDHTLSIEEGKFLIVEGEPDSSRTVATIRSAPLKKLISDSPTVCRMVFYLYLQTWWSEGSLLRIFLERGSDFESRLIFETKVGSKEDLLRIGIDNEVKTWHRVELANIFDDEKEANNNSDSLSSGKEFFFIVFEATLSEYEMIALDDISLTSIHEFKEENASKRREKKKWQEESIELDKMKMDKRKIEPENNPVIEEESTTATILVVLVSVGSLIVIVMVVVSIAHTKQPLNSRVENLRKLSWRRFVTLVGLRSRFGSSSSSSSVSPSPSSLSNDPVEIGEDGNYLALNNINSSGN